MSRFLKLLGVVSIAAALASGGVINIGGFDGTRSARDLAGGAYTGLVSGLANPSNFGPGGINSNTVALLAEVNAITAGNLAGVDVFVMFEVASLSGAEATALSNFVNAGGRVIISTDSGGTGASAGNALLSLLSGGSIDSAGAGNQGPTAGSITGAGLSSVGLFGNLVGGTFGASLGNTLTVGANSTLIGTNSGNNFIMETVFGSGRVLTTSDVLFLDLFTVPGGNFNANNAKLFENFLPSSAASVPEPSGLILIGTGFAVALLLGRRRIVSKG